MSERDRAITTFKPNPAHKALVLSLRPAGQGLNLQEASYVFHFDRWWNPAVEHQAEDRSHRLGQTLPGHGLQVRLRGHDRGADRRDSARKQALFDQLVDDVSIDLAEAPQRRRAVRALRTRAPPLSAKPPEPNRRRYGGMTGEEFERYLGDLLRRLGWSVELTQRSRDGGIDLKAAKSDRVGIETRLYIQCKNQQAPVSVEIVRELNGVLDPTVQGVVAAPSGFTADARSVRRGTRDPALGRPSSCGARGFARRAVMTPKRRPN